MPTTNSTLNDLARLQDLLQQQQQILRTPEQHFQVWAKLSHHLPLTQASCHTNPKARPGLFHQTTPGHLKLAISANSSPGIASQPLSRTSTRASPGHLHAPPTKPSCCSRYYHPRGSSLRNFINRQPAPVRTGLQKHGTGPIRNHSRTPKQWHWHSHVTSLE
jgi:hypothetical protein